ncbi:MAG: hypothetical protein N2746_04240 [Deltaproteobacteria bacterium]|nr:hypothetical protein [Deltaproteobacteria bacterium]
MGHKNVLKSIYYTVVILLLTTYCSDEEPDRLRQNNDASRRDVSYDTAIEDTIVDVGEDIMLDVGDAVVSDVPEDVCIPDCSGKQCGDDGCGGVCGDCGQDAECFENKCRCLRKHDNCNNDWSDGCEVNFYTDPKNCGKCGFVCNVKNVKNVLCEDMVCSYDECIPPYKDMDYDRKNGCEMYFYWPFRYGTVAQESGRAVIETKDGGFLLVGNTNMRGSGNTDILVNKSDMFGETIWQRVVGGDKEDFVVSVAEDVDGNYILGGYSNSFGMGGYDIWLVLFDAIGNVKWQKTYGSVNDDRLFSLKSVHDGFIVGGSYNASCPTCGAILVFKVDRSGDFVWQRQFGGTNDSGAFNLDISPSGDILVSGALNTGCQTCYDAVFLRLDKDGNRIFSKQIGSSDNIERGYAVVATSDGGAIVGGEVPVSGSGLDMFLMKFDKSGNLIWQKTFGGPDNQKIYQVIGTKENNIILLGETMFYGSGQYDCLLIKADMMGNILWQKTYGGDKIDRCYSISLVSDGGYIFVGESYSFDPSLEMIVFKTDRDGVSKGLCPDGFGKLVSLKVNNSSIPVKDLNIQSFNTSAAITYTSAFVDISGIGNKMLCKEK